MLPLLEKKFYISYKAVAWLAGCKKRLLTDQRLSGSGGDRVGGESSSSTKKATTGATSKVVRKMGSWIRPDQTPGTSTLVFAKSVLNSGFVRRSRHKFRWSSKYTRIDHGR